MKEHDLIPKSVWDAYGIIASFNNPLFLDMGVNFVATPTGVELHTPSDKVDAVSDRYQALLSYPPVASVAASTEVRVVPVSLAE